MSRTRTGPLYDLVFRPGKTNRVAGGMIDVNGSSLKIIS